MGNYLRPNFTPIYCQSLSYKKIPMSLNIFKAPITKAISYVATKSYSKANVSMLSKKPFMSYMAPESNYFYSYNSLVYGNKRFFSENTKESESNSQKNGNDVNGKQKEEVKNGD